MISPTLVAAASRDTPQPALPTLERLRTRGQFFETVSGQRTTIVEASDFALYQRYLHQEDIRPVLTQRATSGFNAVRVFGMYNGALGWFIPAEYDSYYTALPAFYRVLASYGLYGEFVAFADAPRVMSSSSDQLQHFSQLVDTLSVCSNALLEAVNEADQPANYLVTLHILPRPVGVLASHGSNGSERYPVTPFWDYATFHTNGAFEWWRKVGHNAMEVWTGPTLANENTRAPDNFNSVEHAYDAAAGAALLCAGSCFHSISGKTSQLWTDEELKLAKAWATGARSVSLDCQDGGYRRRDDILTPELLRVYQRGSSDSCIVRIRK